MLNQHLALTALVDAMQRRRQHQLGAGQEQAEQNLVRQRSVRESAGTQAKTQRRGIGRHQTQAAPARHEAMLFCAGDEPVVERGNGGQRQFGTRLRECLLRNRAQQLGLPSQVSKEGVEFGLDAHAHAAEHKRHQGRQRQFAAPRERRWMLGMSGRLKEFGGL